MSESLTVDLLVVGALLTFLPYVGIQLVLLLRNRRLWDGKAGPPVPSRRILVTIATNGKAPEMADRIAATVNSYRIPSVEVRTLIEEGDPHRYLGKPVVVPGTFSTQNRSSFKCRALHYYSLWLKRNGYGTETYTVHLDDDSVPTRSYIEHALSMTADAGQGLIRLRETGHSTFSTVSDFVRIIDCDTYCAYANSRGKPVHVHGEGLVIRADVESAIGWDFGDRVADDYLMGQRLREAGRTFAHIPACVYIAPPTTTKDFFKQRRRWFTFFHRSVGQSWRMNRTATAWLLLREVSAPATLLGIGIWVAVVLTGVQVPSYLVLACVANMGGALAVGQYGAIRTGGGKNQVLAAALSLPASVYQAASWVYAVTTKAHSFDTVAKK